MKKYILLLLALLAVNAVASVEVLQYHTDDNTVVKYSVPLDFITNIVTIKQYAWAFELPSDPDTTKVSFFDGQTWHAPEVVKGLGGQPTLLQAMLSGEYRKNVMLFTSIKTFGAKPTDQVFTLNDNNQYQWIDANTDADETNVAEGRIWNTKEAANFNPYFQINSKYTGFDLTSINSNAEQVVNKFFQSVIQPTQYAYYDALSDTDYLYFIGYDIDGSGPSADTIHLVTCSVPHQAASPADSVTCTPQLIDLSKLIPSNMITVSVGGDILPFGENGFPIIDVETTTPDGKNIFYHVWSSDNGKSWIADKVNGEVAHTLMDGDYLDSQRICYDLTQPTDTSFKFVCQNHSSSPSTTSTLNFGDPNWQDMRYISRLEARNGIWLAEDSTGQLAYLPFDQSQKQVKLPTEPGYSGLLFNFTVLNDDTKLPGEVISCSTAPYNQDGKTYSGLRFQIADLTNGNWTWRSPDVSLPESKTCSLSQEGRGSLHYMNYPDTSNGAQVVNGPVNIWLFSPSSD